MNRPHRNSLQQMTSSGTVAQTDFQSREIRIRRVVRSGNVAVLGVKAGAGHVGSPSQYGRQGRVGPPVFLTAYCWLLVHRLRNLDRFLKACGKVTTNFVGLVRFSRREGVAARAAVRSNSTFGLRQQGVVAVTYGQTQRNRELGQLCQTQTGLKRYKIGMLANLAMLANVFSQIRPPTNPVPQPA